jgi:RNA polymerase sigma-70 factor (ECF subfamily)
MQQDEGAAAVLAISCEDEEFRVLVERHSSIIFRLAYRMTANEQDAEDVVQETFMRAYQRMWQFENRADFRTWLYRIGVNCALDYIRLRQRYEAGRVALKDINRTNCNALRVPDPLPDGILLANELQERVSAALFELTPKERAAFVLRHFEGCAIEEVARILDVRSNAAKHTVFRAVKKLRKALAPVVGFTK